MPCWSALVVHRTPITSYGRRVIPMAKLLISITNAKNDTDRATVGCVVANASVASGVETVIFLSTEGVRLSQEGYADDIHEEGFAPLKKLLTDFVDAGG